MGWNERSDPDMRTANFKFSCDVYREGVYTDARSLSDAVLLESVVNSTNGVKERSL